MKAELHWYSSNAFICTLFLMGIFALNNLTLEKNPLLQIAQLYSPEMPRFQILPAANPTIWILTEAVLGCFTPDTANVYFWPTPLKVKGQGSEIFTPSLPLLSDYHFIWGNCSKLLTSTSCQKIRKYLWQQSEQN